MQSDGVKTNQSLGKALQIMEYLADQGEPSRLNDIADALDMPSSTILRFLNAMMDAGYVRKDRQSSRYSMTLKITAIGQKVHARFSLSRTLAPYLRETSMLLSESASLCIEEDRQVVYIDVVEGPEKTLQTLQRIGRVAPMYCTGTGKILLLEHSREEIDDYLATRHFTAYTSHTITNAEGILRELEVVRNRGYAFDAEECEVGVKCIAVPIRDFSGRTVASMSISAPVSRLDESRQSRAIETLLDTSVRASIELGWQKPS